MLVLAISVGVAAYGLMIAGSIVLETNLDEAYSASNPAEAILSTSPLDADLLDRIRARSDVAELDLRAFIQTRLLTEPDTWIRLWIHAYPALEDQTLQRFFLQDPLTEPPPTGLLLERSVASLANIQQGDTLQVLDADEQAQPVQISGIVNDLGQLPSNMTTIIYGYGTLDLVEGLGFEAEPGQLVIGLDAQVQDIATINRSVSEIVEMIEDDGRQVHFVHVPEPGKPILGESMSSILIILRSMGVLTLALSGFLVINVMSAFVLRQIPQIGILKSMGGRVPQIRSMYLQQVLLLGLIAFGVAMPLTIGAALVLVDGVAMGLNFDAERFFMPAQAIGLQAISAIVVPLLAALIPIVIGSRISIRAAISDQSERGDVKPGLISRLLAKTAGLPQVWRISILNSFRSRGRIVLTLSALSLAGAMFIAMLGIRESLDENVREANLTQNYDIVLEFERPLNQADLEAVAQNVAGVSQVESWGVSSGRVVFDDALSGSLTLIGIPPETDRIIPVFAQGGWMTQDAAAETVLTMEGWTLGQIGAVGDRMVIRTAKDDYTVKVMGSGWRQFSPQAYVSYDEFEKMTGWDGLANRVIIVTDDSSPDRQDQVLGALQAAYDQEGYAILNAATTTETRGSVSEQLDILFTLLMSMVALIAVVGGLGLAITVSLNVIDRTREIGILRSMGARSPVIRRMVLLESILVAILSWLIGAALSVPLGIWIGSELGVILSGRPLMYIFSSTGLGAWLGLVILVAILASILPANQAARMTIRQALNYEG